MVIEMVDGEPPLFDCPQLQAMKMIRDNPVPSLQHPENVSLCALCVTHFKLCASISITGI